MDDVRQLALLAARRRARRALRVSRHEATSATRARHSSEQVLSGQERAETSGPRV